MNPDKQANVWQLNIRKIMHERFKNQNSARTRRMTHSYLNERDLIVYKSSHLGICLTMYTFQNMHGNVAFPIVSGNTKHKACGNNNMHEI